MPASSSERSAVETRCSIYTRSVMRMRLGPCGSGRPAEDWSDSTFWTPFIQQIWCCIIKGNVLTSLETELKYWWANVNSCWAWFDSSVYNWIITMRKTNKKKQRLNMKCSCMPERISAWARVKKGYLQSCVACQLGRLVVDRDDSHGDGDGEAPAFDLISGGRECEAVLCAFCAVMHVVDVSKFHLERTKKKKRIHLSFNL